MVSLMLEQQIIDCPYCGEYNMVMVDTTAGSAEYTEDCQVCCNPILINVSIADDESVTLQAVREND